MALLLNLKLFILMKCSTYGLIYAGEVIKCLNMPTEKVQISCPSGHVIYNPIILSGASASQACVPNPSDCIGISKDIKRQTERCFWKKRCTIRFCNPDKITTCRNSSVTAPANITYVVIKQMFCIPKEFIIDICTKPPKGFDFSMGIIRSHRGYPRRKPQPTSCAMSIPIMDSKTLILEIVSEEHTFPLGLSLQKVRKSDLRTENISTIEQLMLHGNTTKALTISVDYRRNWKENHGFMLPFAAYKSSSLDTILTWPNRSRPVLKELGWILEARPVLEQCAAGVMGSMYLVCDKDEVIYYPAISMSGYTRRESTCIFSKKNPCGGYSPELLVQRNSCYWKNSCNISWKKAGRIVISKKWKCIGYSASSIGLSGHRCVPKDNIFDLCTNVTRNIDDSWGIIRSHPAYPWYFDAAFTECKRIVFIGGGQALMLIVQDMNIDPDGKDKFSVKHVTKKGHRKVMDAKSGKEGYQIIVKGGKLVIKFKSFKSSKSGRGFVLVFRRFPVSRWGIANISNQSDYSATVNGTLSDAAAMTTYRLSNRRLCSKRGKQRRKGHACNRRVWTDYFTRLE